MATSSATPSTGRKIGAWAMLVLGGLGVLLLVAGIVSVWALNTPATNLLTSTIETVLGPLQQAQTGLQEVDAALDSAQTAVTDMQLQVEKIGVDLQADSLILKKLGELVGDDLLTSVDNALETLGRLKLTLAGIQGILDGLDNLPFVDLPEWAQDISDAITEIERVGGEVRETLAALEAVRLGAIEKAVSAVTDKAKQIEGRLTNVQTRVQTAESRLDQIVGTLEGWRDGLPRLIDVASIIVTLLLAWLAFGQWALLSLGWSYVRTGRWIPFYPLAKDPGAGNRAPA
ncbi:MAG TPA: hypothetical protein VLL77_05695 [Anaerolineales bacterium]|nr:hypothetical protein [Anaerolineales bacterium]